MILCPCGADLFSTKSLEVMLDSTIKTNLIALQDKLFDFYVGTKGGSSCFSITKGIDDEDKGQLQNFEDYIIPWNKKVREMLSQRKNGRSLWQGFLDDYSKEFHREDSDRDPDWKSYYSALKMRSRPWDNLPKIGPFLLSSVPANGNRYAAKRGHLTTGASAWIRRMKDILLQESKSKVLHGSLKEGKTNYPFGNLYLTDDLDLLVVPFSVQETNVYICRYDFTLFVHIAISQPTDVLSDMNLPVNTLECL